MKRFLCPYVFCVAALSSALALTAQTPPASSAAAKVNSAAKPAGTTRPATAARRDVCPKVKTVDDSKSPALPPVHGCKVLYQGIAYIDTQFGMGVTARWGTTVSIAFSMRSTDGHLISSGGDGTHPPLNFAIGSHAVVAGFESGIENMNAGGERRLLIPAKYIVATNVPPNTDVIADVKLLTVNGVTGFDKDNIPNAAEAIRHYTPLAAKGDTDAAEKLGEMYLSAPKPIQNYPLAAQMLRKAIAGGKKDGTPLLATMMLLGEGVTRNEAAARNLLKEQGDDSIDALLLRSLDLPENKAMLEDSYQFTPHADLGNLPPNKLQEMVMQGNIRAMDTVAYKTLQDKSKPYAESDSTASGFHFLMTTWYAYQALKGYAQAQLELGRKYMSGEGVPQDPYAAIALFQKAAKAGNGRAIESVAWAYAYGNGVEVNEAHALELAQQAANTGDPVAQFNLAQGYQYESLGAHKDLAQAAAWYQKAADKGYYMAQHELAYLYQTGQGVPLDTTKALHYYQAAADQGFVVSMNAVASFYRDGIGIPANPALARQYFTKAGNTTAIAAMDKKEQEARLAAMRTAGSVPTLEALPFIPKDLIDKIVDGYPKSIHDFIRQPFDICTKNPGQGATQYQIADACMKVEGNFANMLNWDHGVNKDWLAKHNYTHLTEHLMDSARQRACALGSADGCNMYGVSLVALKRPEEAKKVWLSQPCITNAKCKESFAKQFASDPQIADFHIIATPPPPPPAPVMASVSRPRNSGAPMTHEQWQEKVDRLTREVQTAEQDAANAEALANQYKNNSDNISSHPSGTWADIFAVGLNSGASIKYQRDADKKRKKANELRSQLDQLHAAQPAAITEANNADIVQTAKSSGDSYVNTSISTQQQQATLHQTVANIGAMQTNTQTQQATMRPATTTTTPPPSSSAASTQSTTATTGRCPNGKYVDTAHQCDCRQYSASIYGCPGPSGSSSSPQAVASATQPVKTGTSAPTGIKPVSTTPAKTTTASTTTTASNIHPSPGTPAPVPTYANTGTVKPADCVAYDVTKPCIPMAIWQQIATAPETYSPPTNTPTGPPQVYYIVNADIPDGPGVHWCPKSGTIYTGHYVANDVWEGQIAHCSVGYHFRITWPGSTMASAPSGSSNGNGYNTASNGNGSGSSGSGSGPGSTGGTGSGSGSGNNKIITPIYNGCVKGKWEQDKTFPKKQDLWFNSLCALDVSVTWFLGNGMGQAASIHSFATVPTPNGVYPGNSMRLSIYVCPTDHPVPVKADGNQVDGHDEKYFCSTSLSGSFPSYLTASN